MLTIARVAPMTAILATLLAALPATPRATHAQSLRAREVGFGAGVASLVLLNRVHPYRPGSPGQHDPMLGRDKALHFGAAALGTAAGTAFGTRPGFAAATMCASGVAFEYTQRRVSARDMVADCSGAALAWGIHRLVARMHRHRER